MASRVLHQLQNYHAVVRVGFLKKRMHAYRYPAFLWDEAIELLMEKKRVRYVRVKVACVDGRRRSVQALAANKETANWATNRIPDPYEERRKKKRRKRNRGQSEWLKKHLSQMRAGQRHSFHLNLAEAVLVGAISLEDAEAHMEETAESDSDIYSPW